MRLHARTLPDFGRPGWIFAAHQGDRAGLPRARGIVPHRRGPEHRKGSSQGVYLFPTRNKILCLSGVCPGVPGVGAPPVFRFPIAWWQPHWRRLIIAAIDMFLRGLCAAFLSSDYSDCFSPPSSLRSAVVLRRSVLHASSEVSVCSVLSTTCGAAGRLPNRAINSLCA